MFDSLSERLSGALANLRGKGRLSDADIDATAREIRIALLEADVALPVVRAFIARIKERAKGAEVSGALNPAQQVVKIVNEELIAILGGETRRLRLAKKPPTVIMLAGLQGSGKTTLAGKLGALAQGSGPHTAAGGVRPAAAQRGEPAADRRRARRRADLRAPSGQRRSRRTGASATGQTADPATASAIRSTWRGAASRTPATSTTTSSSSTPPAGSASTAS